MKQENLYEALKVCKENRITNFKTYVDPWKNPDYERARLTGVDYQNKTATVTTPNRKTEVAVEESILELLKEMGHYYGATAFIEKGVLVNFSYQYDKTELTPVTTIEDGVIVYE